MSEASEARKARYYDRKCAQVCVDCKAGLQDEDGVRCVECAEKDRRVRSEYNASEHGRTTRRASDRSRYAARTEAGDVCRKCGAPPMFLKRFCKQCREENTRATAAWRARKKLIAAGVIVLSEEKARRRKKARPPAPAPIYATVTDRPWRDRVLLALRFCDWIAPRDLGELLGIAEGAAQARNSAQKRIIDSLIPEGLVERRRSVGGEGLAVDRYEYRLTPAGVIAAEKARAA